MGTLTEINDYLRVLFARTRYGLAERPFSATDLYELDLETLEPVTEIAGQFEEPGGSRIGSFIRS